MKKYLFGAAIFALIGFTACNEQSAATEETESTESATTEAVADPAQITADNVEELTSIEFTEEAFDFGEITQGEKVEHTFKFKNTGENDLVIVSAKGSCGCTIPEWPKEPIAP